MTANVPVILWGHPGQGKTSVIEALAADYGLHLETVIASISEPADFGGLPIVDQRDKTVTRAPQSWAKRLADHGSGIVFYDEISTAPPSVQAALLRPILSGWVGDLQLPPEVRSIAAANPADVAADGWDLAPPMANRFCHLAWELTADVVRNGFTSGWPKVQFPTVDPSVMEREIIGAKMLVGLFIGARPEQLTRVPTSADAAGRAFPTPRSWEMAARLYGVCEAADVGSSVRNLVVIGCVGVGAASEFLTYAAHLDLPEPEVMLRDPDSLVVPSERGDKVYAIAASVWTATKNNNTAPRWVACGEVLAKIAAANHADIAFSFGTCWAKDRAEGAMPSANAIKHLVPILTELSLLTQHS